MAKCGPETAVMHVPVAELVQLATPLTGYMGLKTNLQFESVILVSTLVMVGVISSVLWAIYFVLQRHWFCWCE